MLAGRLRHKVIVERRVDARAAGAIDFDWQELFTTLAEINIFSGSEGPAGQQVQALATTKIRMRYKDGVDATCRVRRVLPPAVFDILTVMEDLTGQRELILLCNERVTEGWRRGDDA